MIKGPWPMSADKTRYEIPLKPPYLTPMFQGERVALRVSMIDETKWRRAAVCHGIITDLDTGKRYRLHGRPCSLPRCCCDAEIVEITTSE